MEATLEAVQRDGRGKNEANRLRAQGRIPAVVYGARDGKSVSTAIAVDPKELSRILHSESGVNTLITLKLDGKSSRVLVREYQLDPMTHHMLHADFYQLALDKRLRVPVPVLLKGEPKGVKQQGGVLDVVHREIQVECLPTDIPEHIDVDVSELLIGQSIRVRDLPVNPKWTAVDDGDTMVAHVVAPRAEEAPAEGAEAATAAPAAPAEPEVIKKGKTEKPEEEAKK